MNRKTPHKLLEWAFRSKECTCLEEGPKFLQKLQRNYKRQNFDLIKIMVLSRVFFNKVFWNKRAQTGSKGRKPRVNALGSVSGHFYLENLHYMSKIYWVEIHHDVAEVDKTYVVHARDEKNLFVRLVCFGPFLSKNTLPLMGLIYLPRSFMIAVHFHFTDVTILKLYHSWCFL